MIKSSVKLKVLKRIFSLYRLYYRSSTVYYLPAIGFTALHPCFTFLAIVNRSYRIT